MRSFHSSHYGFSELCSFENCKICSKVVVVVVVSFFQKRISFKSLKENVFGIHHIPYSLKMLNIVLNYALKILSMNVVDGSLFLFSVWEHLFLKLEKFVEM